MEKIHLELQSYSHKERNQKIVEYLNSLNTKEIRKILKKRFKGYKNYFHFAVMFNYVDIAEAFLKHDANLVKDSLLHYAASENLTEMTITFLQYNKKHIDFRDFLRNVILNNHQDVLMFVLKKLRYDITLEDMLYFAAIFGRTQIARILIMYGAEIDFIFRKKIFGFGNVFSDGSALGLAVRYRNLETVNLLLRFGASLNIRGMDGLFPIETSLDHGNNSLFKSMVMHIGLK